MRNLIETLKRRFRKNKWTWGDQAGTPTDPKPPEIDDGKTFKSVAELLQNEERDDEERLTDFFKPRQEK